MKVYESINRVQAGLAAVGIGKDRKNQAQGYNFRGIDDVYNALSPLLAKHGLCILPRIVSRSCEERVNGKGTALFYVTVEAEFDLVSSEDASKHTIRTFGEAMDSGDKATNKAMSAAYKYACMQAFAIPTEGDNDADAHTPEVAPRTQQYIDEAEIAVDHLAPALRDAATMMLVHSHHTEALSVLARVSKELEAKASREAAVTFYKSHKTTLDAIAAERVAALTPQTKEAA
jgi:hypothetical protein